MVPLCSYVRTQGLQGVTLASGMPSTDWTTWSARLAAITRPCRPAVLLSKWAPETEPENLLAALQSNIVGKVPLRCVAFMVPLCQEGYHLRVPALCKGWLLDDVLAFGTSWAASSVFADALTKCCSPLVATGITEPSDRLIALCHRAVRCTIICCVVPLSCNPGSLGGQAVVLANFTAAALRATSACRSV